MRCSACEHEVDPGARFCESCGTPVARTCGGCGATLSATARFCSQCGQADEPTTPRDAATEPTSDAASEPADPPPRDPSSQETAGERRQLTVLFCDLVGSTELGQRLDPEDLGDLLRAYHDACTGAIKGFEGHVAQYLGDGVLAWFGFPAASENDAERGVRAALGIQATLRELNERRRAAGVPEIEARIGIHTGLVVVSDIGDDAHQPMALGDTMNVAARLEGIAEPGGVVISQATLGLVPGLFVTRELGRPSLKGVSDEIIVYAVDGAAGVTGRIATQSTTPLSGRDLELRQLLDRWEEVQEGRGQVITISGEAGIGKSRIVVALRDELKDAPHTWLEILCSPYASGSAFQPVLDLYERGFDFSDHDSPEARLEKLERSLGAIAGLDLADTVPYLAAVLGLPESPRFPLPQLSPELQRERTIQALITPLLAVEAQQPVVLACEDLHWCDRSTLELLGRLIDQAPTQRLLVLTTARPTFDPPWPMGRSYLTPITLSRLSPRHAREMVASSTGGRLPERILEEVVMRADGVPLFAEELARSVVDSGMIVESNGRYEFRGRISDLTIPSTLQGSLMARLDRLSAAKQVAQLAATLGRDFPYELIAAIGQLAEPALRSGLGQLVEAEILFQRGTVPEAVYTFKHALLQDTAYESQLKSRRRELHARIATTLEERFPQRVAAEPERIARHCAEGGLGDKAVAYYQLAGGQALSRFANAEAVEYYDHALEQIPSLPAGVERQQREVELQVARLSPLTALRSYEDPDVVACCARIEQLSDEMGTGPQQLGALVGLSAYTMQRGDTRNASRHAEALLAIAEPLGLTPLLVAAHMILGSAAVTAAEIGVSRRHLAKALELGATVELPPPASAYDYDVPSLGHSTQAISMILSGEPERGLESLASAIGRAESIGHVNTTATTYLTGSITAYFVDDPKLAMQHADSALALVRDKGFHTVQTASHVYRGWARVMTGDVDGGLAEYEEGLAGAEASGAMAGLVQLYLTGVDSMIVGGRLDRAEALLAKAAGAIERTGERAAFEPQLPMFRAAILLARGSEDVAAIQALLDDSVVRWRAFGSAWMEVRSAILEGQLALRTGKHGEARAHLESLCASLTEGHEIGRMRDARARIAELG